MKEGRRERRRGRGNVGGQEGEKERREEEGGR